MLKKIIYGVFYIALLFLIIPFVAVTQFMNAYTDGIKKYIKNGEYNKILEYESSYYDPNALYKDLDNEHMKIFINDIYMLDKEKDKEDKEESYTRYIQFRFIDINKEDMKKKSKDLSKIILTFKNDLKEPSKEESEKPLNEYENALLFNNYIESNFLINQLYKVSDFRKGSAITKIELFNSKGESIIIINDLNINVAEDKAVEEIKNLEPGMSFNKVFKLYFKTKQIIITLVWFLVITLAYGALGYIIFRKKSPKYHYVPRNPRPNSSDPNTMVNRKVLENNMSNIESEEKITESSLPSKSKEDIKNIKQ